MLSTNDLCLWLLHILLVFSNGLLVVADDQVPLGTTSRTAPRRVAIVGKDDIIPLIIDKWFTIIRTE
jgi:hypothetical protein